MFIRPLGGQSAGLIVDMVGTAARINVDRGFAEIPTADELEAHLRAARGQPAREPEPITLNPQPGHDDPDQPLDFVATPRKRGRPRKNPA